MRRKLALLHAGTTVFLALVLASPALAGVETVPGGVRFSYVDAGAGQVFLAGDFNGWSAGATPMTKAGGTWSAVVSLGPGPHEYKFVVDGNWVADPLNPVTVGDFGNSGFTIGPDGKLVSMKATSNTELSPKIFLGSRYVTLMDLRRDSGSNPRWNLDRPQFDIDLDFTIRMNEVLTAHVLTNINNQNENVQMWETSLVFDRGSMTVDTPDIRFTGFDNDPIEDFDDPLVLLGAVGIYNHAWGFNQQGTAVWKEWRGFQAEVVYSDDFRTGGISSADVTLAPDPGMLPERPQFVYAFENSDHNKDVLALRVKRDLNSKLRAGISLRSDRGANPGAYGELIPLSASRVAVNSYANTVENWHAGGADLDYRNEKAGVDLFGEFLVGESSIKAESGQRTEFTLNGDAAVPGPSVVLPERDIRLDTSKRFVVGGRYYAYRGWHWTGSVEFENHDLAPASNDSLTALDNRLTTYKVGVAFDGEEWKHWTWKGGLDLEIYDFHYDAATPFGSQIWFDRSNFWLEQGEHEVTVDRTIMMTGDNLVTWRPHGEWMFYAPRKAKVRYSGILNATKLGRKPKYWENNLMFHVDLTPRIGLNTDSRWVRYDDPVLNLNETYLSHFVELKYTFTSAIDVGLSWGVDPWVIDPVTNEYDHIGRDRFLFDRGADAVTAQTRFVDLGRMIRAAESALEDENRFQLEAIVKY